jgi:hydrogenase expression/formation protein HypE
MAKPAVLPPGNQAYGLDAAIIGKVQGHVTRGRLVVNTMIGGSREVDLPTGELVPRIC